MNNMSRETTTVNEDASCTAISMYLSFDAESSVSTAAFKTLDETSDTVASPSLETGNDSCKGLDDADCNSTLEADRKHCSHLISPSKTIKKNNVVSASPLRPLPKNILQECNIICSTPSKEQLMRTVEVRRGSDDVHLLDLGIGFMNVEEGKPIYPPLPQKEDNKENNPENDEGSILSVSSSTEVASSIIERKIAISPMSTVDEELLEENWIESETAKASAAVLNMRRSIEITPKLKLETKDLEVSLDENSIKHSDQTSNSNEVEKVKEEMSCGVLSVKNKRRSICEPKIKLNCPPRISDQKRKSLLPTTCQSSNTSKAEREIPSLFNKMLKIAESMEVDRNRKVSASEETKVVIQKRRTMMPSTKSCTLQRCAGQGEKRPFSFTQRMSVVLKTTLNSPARKIARRMVTPQRRRSLLPTKIGEGVKRTNSATDMARRSMLPRTATTMTATVGNTSSRILPVLKENGVAEPQSLKPLVKQTEKLKCTQSTLKTVSANLKSELNFTCNVCNEKFRIKSLLEAHKRSHEVDGIPGFVKKTLSPSGSGSLSNHSNQCKYCDKKFALTRALHIHLLQNCAKIPPADKRKLHYTEMDHVGKAQLPKVFSHHHSNPSSSASSVSATPKVTGKYNTNNYRMSGDPLIGSKASETVSSNDDEFAAPSAFVGKSKKTTAHAGVYRTPSKSIPCHLCKQTFKSILDYTNHCMTIHANANANTHISIKNE